MINLTEMELGYKTKLECEECKGLGIKEYFEERYFPDTCVDFCHECDGKGYFETELNESKKLFLDKEHNMVYAVIDGEITQTVKLFQELDDQKKCIDMRTEKIKTKTKVKSNK